jgi:hypothetical protein
MFTIHYEGVLGTSWIEFGKLSGNYEPNYVWANMPDGSDRWNMRVMSTNYKFA